MFMNDQTIFSMILGILIITILVNIVMGYFLNEYGKKIKSMEQSVKDFAKLQNNRVNNKKIEDVLVPLDYLIELQIRTKIDLGLIPLNLVSDTTIRDDQLNNLTEDITLDVINLLGEAAKNDILLFISEESYVSFVSERVFLRCLGQTNSFNKTQLKSRIKK